MMAMFPRLGWRSLSLRKGHVHHPFTGQFCEKVSQIIHVAFFKNAKIARIVRLLASELLLKIIT